jgi:hypothetical protein
MENYKLQIERASGGVDPRRDKPGGSPANFQFSIVHFQFSIPHPGDGLGAT